MMTDSDRQKLDITRYYNRDGLAAAGAADEWLAAAQADARERLKNMDPRMRSKMSAGINSFVLGHYQNLRAFESREVRKGRVERLAMDIENRANGISMNIAAQSRAELESEREERENIDRTAAEMSRTDAEAAERHRAAAYEGLDISRAKRTDEHFLQLVGEMDMAETMIDSAVEEGLIDRVTGDARKRKAARACFSNTISALSANGDHDMAEAFIARLEMPRETEPSKTGSGKGDTVSQLGALYGFDANDIATLRARNEYARGVAEVKAARNALAPGFEAANAPYEDYADFPQRRVDDIDRVIGDIRSRMSRLPKDSEARAVLSDGMAKLDARADNEAAQLVENTLMAREKPTFETSGKGRFARAYQTVKAKVDKMRDDVARKGEAQVQTDNARDLEYDELMLDYAVAEGTLTRDEIASRRRALADRVTAMAKGRFLKPKDAVDFGRRMDARNTKDESIAAVEFDRAFGLSLTDFADARGNVSTEVTDSGYKKAVKSGQKAIFPGTDEKVSLGEYLKIRASFLERLRALPANADRRQETAKLLEKFKGGWYARQTEANIAALSRTMNDIHLGIEAEVEAERLKAAAEEEKRNMPLVDMRHPANAAPATDPLEYYRQANPLDPTLNLR